MGINLNGFVDQVQRLPTRSRLVLIAIAFPGSALLILGSGGLAIALFAAGIRLLGDGVTGIEDVLVFAAGSALAFLATGLAILTTVLVCWAFKRRVRRFRRDRSPPSPR
jgi:hypothetical protein